MNAAIAARESIMNDGLALNTELEFYDHQSQEDNFIMKEPASLKDPYCPRRQEYWNVNDILSQHHS
jgi:hypothetical protein